MNLVKWFRKNNMKVMAVVIIIIMVGFVAGPLLQRLGQGGRRTSQHKTVAYYSDNKKMTNYDLALARQELEILQMLRADDLLKSQDLRGILLGELLFSEQRANPVLINYMKQLIRKNDYRISNEQINDIYNRSTPSNVPIPPNMYWLLLRNEAQTAGIRIPNENIGKLLGQVIPQLFNGLTYSQRIGAIIDQQGIPQEEILTTFGNLLGVLQYAHLVCSNEDVTTRQIMHAAGLENETIDVEFVKFDPDVFAKTQGQADPNSKSEISNLKSEISKHFDKYKKFVPGDVSEDNPYGFGYKLPDRAQLEYIAVKLDDVKTVATPPTQQEAEEYYEKNREQLFTEQIPSDPNDPNSPLITRTRSYAEVVGVILDQLLQDKINSTAEKIISEAKKLTEAGLEEADIELEKLSTEQFKELAGDYKAAAKQLSENHKIKIYTGLTGLLSAVDMQADMNLGTLLVRGSGQSQARLTQLVFALDQFGRSELEAFNVQKYKIYENIGPARDFLGQTMALLRVIKAEKASVPESINQTFSTRTLKLDPNQAESDEDVYSVKEKVDEDFKKLNAMNTTKNKAEEFLELAAKDGWDNAIDKFNKLYGQQDGEDENDDPNVFKLQNFTGLRRISSAALLTLKEQNAGELTERLLINQVKIQKLFIDQIYSLVPRDSDSPGVPPLIKEFKPDKPMEFKPDMSFYCLKSISVKRLGLEEYEQLKARRLFREEHIQSQSLAAVHFSPKNILKRTNFRLAETNEENKEPADANAPTKI